MVSYCTWKWSNIKHHQWQEVVKDIIKEFTPAGHAESVQDRWANMRQTSSIADYNSRFLAILLELPLPFRHEDLLLDKYIRDLRPATQKEVRFREPQSYSAAMKLAVMADSILFPSRSTTSKNLSPSVSSSPRRLGKLTEEERLYLRSINGCFKCRKPGHIASNCPMKSTSSPAVPDTSNSTATFTHSLKVQHQ